MIVLDASALVDALIGQSERAWVLEQLAGQKICAPAHQPVEVLSALARLTRTGDLDVPAERAALDTALTLRQEFVVLTDAHLRRALALQDQIRVADGLYVALAEERSCPLVTTDRRLGRAYAPCEVRTPPGNPQLR